MKKLLILLLFISNLIYAGQKKSPEVIFLDELHELSLTYGAALPPLRSSYYKIEQSIERENEVAHYNETVPKMRKAAKKVLMSLLDDSGPFKYEKIAKEYLKQKTPVSPLKLYNFFKPLVESGAFKIKTGDVLLILTHSYRSLVKTYVMESAYSHNDLIFIDQNNIPMVFCLTAQGVLKISLARYLSGYFNYVQDFAILRYNQNINNKVLLQLIDKVDKNFHNLFFDDFYLRDSKITDVSSFMERPTFYYCTELVFDMYRFVLKNDIFITNDYTSISQMIKNREAKISAAQEVFISYARKVEKMRKKWIVDFKNFYESSFFSATVVYNEMKSVKDKLINFSKEK